MLTAKQVCEAMTVLDESVRVDPSCITADLPESNNKGTAVFDNGHLRRVNNTDECKRLGFVPVKKKYLLKYFGTVYPVLNAHMLDNLRMYHIGMKEFNDAKNNRVRTKKPSRPPKLFKKRTPFAAQITTLDELFHRKLCANYDELLDADDWRDEVNKLIGDDKLLKAYRALYNVKHATKKTIKAAVEELNTLLDEEKITDSDMQSMKTAAEGKRTALITASQSNVTTGINKTFMDMWTDDFVFVKLPQKFTGVIAEKPEIPQLAHLEAPEAAKAKPPTPAKAETPEERKKREKERKEREKDEKDKLHDEKDKPHDEKRAMGAGILFLEGDKCSPFPGHFRTTPYQNGYRKAQESFFKHWVREVYAKNVNLIRESDALWAQYREDKKSGYYCERPPFLNKQKLWSEANFALMNEMRRVRIQPGEDIADNSITFEVFVVPDYEKKIYLTGETMNVTKITARISNFAYVQIQDDKMYYTGISDVKDVASTLEELYKGALNAKRKKLRRERREKKREELRKKRDETKGEETKGEETKGDETKGEETKVETVLNNFITRSKNIAEVTKKFAEIRKNKPEAEIQAIFEDISNDEDITKYFNVEGKSIFKENLIFDNVVKYFASTREMELGEKVFNKAMNNKKKKKSMLLLDENDEFLKWTDVPKQTKARIAEYLRKRAKCICNLYLIGRVPEGLENKTNEEIAFMLDTQAKQIIKTTSKLKVLKKDLLDDQTKKQMSQIPTNLKNISKFADPDLALMQQDLAYGSRGYKAAEVSE